MKMLEGFELGKEDSCKWVELGTSKMRSIRNGKFTINVEIKDFDCDILLVACEKSSEDIRYEPKHYDFGTVQKERLVDKCFWENFYAMITDAICVMLDECEEGI